MCKKEVIFLTVYREVLLRLEPTKVIDLERLNRVLGICFHIPRHYKMSVVKELVNSKVLKPRQEDRWRDFDIIE